jgi:hypothetical protein
MQELFKDAIAEAKHVREATIAEATERLTENITPHFRELLAAKLQEMEKEEEADVVSEEDIEEADFKAEGDYGDEDMKDEAAADDDSEESEEEAEDGEVEDEPEDMESDEEEIEVKDMEIEDLKNFIRDIISQEVDVADATGDEFEDELGVGEEEPVDDMMGVEDEEEIDIKELLRELEALANEGETADKEEAMYEEAEPREKPKVSKTKGKTVDENSRITVLEAELKEAVDTIKSIKDELRDTRVTEAKLKYLNKAFVAFTLSEAQKVKLVGAFDKATTIKEAELVYNAIVETFDSSKEPVLTNEHRGFASKATGNSTKPENTEGSVVQLNETFQRMQKLAGII